ncbi:hypothetical protein [Rhizobium sp.]|jgi:hypothetical protein|uniref:hypothetical protein n=1 Tax=Rhizobium sp. TaxID=391 RepID=UPI000E98A9EB|nr:hypothetical protein [Rhizobium sp.]
MIDLRFVPFWVAFFGGQIAANIKLSIFGLWLGSATLVIWMIAILVVFFYLIDRYWTRKP